MRWLLAFLVSAICLAPVYAADTEKTSPLSRPVTLSIKGEALVDVMPMLEKQTGVRLRVSKEIADQKVTLFVDNKPLKAVMDGIATLFTLRWTVKKTRDGSVYELWEPEKTRQDRQSQWQKAVEDTWKALDAKLPEYLKQLPKDMAEFRDTWSTATTSQTTPDGREANQKLQAYKTAVNAWILRNTPDQARQAFLSDIMVCFDSRSPEQQWRMPDDVAEAFANSWGLVHHEDDGSRMLPFDSSNMRAFVRVYPNIMSRRDRAFLTTTADVGYSSLGTPTAGQAFRMSVVFHQTLLDTIDVPASSAPSDPLPHAQDGSVLSKRVSISASDLVQEAGVPGQKESPQWFYANKADILALLHRKLGIQIIADYYSQWYPEQPAQDVEVRSVIPQMPDSYVGAANGFLYVRTVDTPTYDASEVPNSILRPLQQIAKTGGKFGLDEWAQLALLAESQMGQLEVNAKYLNLPLSIESAMSFSAGKENLRLYGMLTPAHRAQLSTVGVKVGALNLGERSALAACLHNEKDTDNIGTEFAIKVGIYKNGLRIDKQEPPSPGDPVLIRMQEGITNDAHAKVPLVAFMSPEGAAPKPSTIGAPDGGYTMTLLFDDGHKRDLPLIVPGMPSKQNGMAPSAPAPGWGQMGPAK